MQTKDLASALEFFSDRARAAVSAAEAEALADAKREALASSSGPLTRRDLVRMDHPFARRHGTALEDPEVINSSGRGDFARAWSTGAISSTSEGTEGDLTNDSESAHWLSRGGQGKSKMVARPVIARVARLVGESRRIRTMEAFRRAGRSIFSD